MSDKASLEELVSRLGELRLDADGQLCVEIGQDASPPVEELLHEATVRVAEAAKAPDGQIALAAWAAIQRAQDAIDRTNRHGITSKDTVARARKTTERAQAAVERSLELVHRSGTLTGIPSSLPSDRDSTSAVLDDAARHGSPPDDDPDAE